MTAFPLEIGESFFVFMSTFFRLLSMYIVKGGVSVANYLANYGYFTTKPEVVKAIQQHIVKHKKTLNDTDLKVLKVLSAYAEKYGAAHIKHATIESAIGKSNATVRRSLRKLESLKIIERTHYVRPIMNGLGANIYAIKPFNQTLNFQSDGITRIMNSKQQSIFEYL